MADCVIERKNLGLSKCNKLPALIRGMITTSMNFKILAANLENATTWQDALLAEGNNRIYMWPPFVGFENASEAAVYEDTPLAMLKVRDGKYAFRFFVSENLCLHKAMYSHNGKARVFFIDTEGQIIGTKDSNGDLRGFTASLINTEKLVLSDGSVSTKTPVFVVLANSKELDKSGALVDGSEFIDTLERIVDVDVTVVGTPSSTEIVVDVKVSCDGTPVTGLVTADFLLLEADGDEHTITSATESSDTPGRYTLVGTGFVDGTITLAPAADLSVLAYENPTPATVNVP